MVEQSMGWTPEVERVVERATEQARSVGHRRLGSEHLLLALLAQPEGGASAVLDALQLKFDEVRAEILQVMPGSSRPVEGELPMTESAAGALHRAGIVARRLHAERIDTDHLLLGVAAQHESAASRVLLDFGATTEKVRRLVDEMTAERKTHACRECGQALESAWRFCPMCGTARVIQ